jgi:glycosyltransferase involved in cell wall biosynthesis
MKRPSIAFVAPYVYPILARRDDVPYVGGAELQQTELITMLAGLGYPTSLIAGDFDQPDREVRDGITIDKLPRLGERGIKGLRFIHPRLTDYLPLLARQQPDIIYARAASPQVAACGYFARRSRAKFIYAAASDRDFNRGAISGVTRRDAALFRWGMRRADAIIVQNLQQQEALRKNWGRDGVVIPNMFEDPQAKPAAFEGPILFVGTLRQIKQPELFIELARALPERRFRMIGGASRASGGDAYYEQIQRLAALVPNLEFAGFVPVSTIGTEFDGAGVLVNTSEIEGFPNTFLQAWARGIPTLSFVAPTGRNGATGTVRAADFNDMVRHLRLLTREPAAWGEAAARGKAQFERDHTKSTAAVAYQDLLTRLCA